MMLTDAPAPVLPPGMVAIRPLDVGRAFTLDLSASLPDGVTIQGAVIPDTSVVTLGGVTYQPPLTLQVHQSLTFVRGGPAIDSTRTQVTVVVGDGTQQPGLYRILLKLALSDGSAPENVLQIYCDGSVADTGQAPSTTLTPVSTVDPDTVLTDDEEAELWMGVDLYS